MDRRAPDGAPRRGLSFDAYSPREIAERVEHSIANMYFFPIAFMLQAAGGEAPDFGALGRNLAPVIAGNLVGGSVLVALVYHVIYRRPGAR